MFDRLRTGWFSVNVTSYPDKIYDALTASVGVRHLHLLNDSRAALLELHF